LLKFKKQGLYKTFGRTAIAGGFTIFHKRLFFERKALPTTFLPSVKTLTKNVIFVFLSAQTFLKKKALPKKQGFSFSAKRF